MTAEFCWHFWVVTWCFYFFFWTKTQKNSVVIYFFTRILLILLFEFSQQLTSANDKLNSELFWSFWSKLVIFAEYLFHLAFIVCIYLFLWPDSYSKTLITFLWLFSLLYAFASLFAKILNKETQKITNGKRNSSHIGAINELGVKPLKDH